MKKNINYVAKWQKYFKLDQQYFASLNEYATGKMSYNWFKKLMLGIFGGLFVGFGYTAYLFIAGNIGGGMPEYAMKLIGALLFPVALLLCIYFGGSLFTSSCVGIVPVVCKQKKWPQYISDLSLVLLGNGVGGMIFALIVWASNLFGGVAGVDVTDAGKHAIEMTLDRIDESHQWWNNIFSGILCNFIVAGTAILSVVTKKNAIGVFLIYLMLIIFVLTGLQHVVANLYLFTLSGFLSISQGGTPISADQAGQLFYVNLIPALIGNFSGGIGLTLLYMHVQSFIGNKKNANKPNDDATHIEIIHK